MRKGLCGLRVCPMSLFSRMRSWVTPHKAVLSCSTGKPFVVCLSVVCLLHFLSI